MSIDYPVNCFSLKWAFNHFVRPDCIDHSSSSSNELGVVASAHHFPVIILFRASQMVKSSSVHLLNFPSYQTAGVAQQSPQVARLRRARSLTLFPSQDPPPSRASSRRLLAPWQRSCRPIATARLAISPLPLRAPAAPE